MNDAALSSVEVTGGPVEVLDLPAAAGAGGLAPLVLLHEGLGSVALWRGLPTALHEATGRRTIAFSRHGYGFSAPAVMPRLSSYLHHEAELLAEVLAAVDVVDPVLVGHSDGASIALLHAGMGFGTPTGLVLLAPHVLVEDVSIAGIEQARDLYRSSRMGERMGRYHADPDTTFWGWNDVWLSDDFRSWDIREHLQGVACPVLLVQGVDDEYGTLRQLDLIEQGVAGPTTRLELDACRHAPHLDRPDTTLEALVAFLRG